MQDFLTQKMVNFTKPLDAVEAGQVIEVTGSSNHPNRFDIDLTSGDGVEWDSGNIALHISVRFGIKGEIVRNTFDQDTGWGHEERKDFVFPENSLNPVHRGGEFKISIYVDIDMFFISIDDTPFCTYPFRKPLSEIMRINILGDVEKLHGIKQFIAKQN